MFSSNIIDRHQAMSDLLSLNGANSYSLMVVVLGLIAWGLAKWI